MSKNKEEDIKYPICPINLYFEGDKCDQNKCDFDVDVRMCSEACQRK